MNNMPNVNIATFHFYNIRPQSSIITLQQNFPLVYLQAQQRYLSTCEITLIKTVFTERNNMFSANWVIAFATTTFYFPS